MITKLKVGKTTLASKFENALILGFEPGQNALYDVYVQNILTWTEVKQVLGQLRNQAIKDKFHCIVFDTVDKAWEACERYICQQAGVQNIGDIPYGGGYAKLSKEFSKVITEIAQLGYGLVFISHDTEKTLKDSKNAEYTQIIPAAPTRARDIVNKLVDFIIYACKEYDEDKKENRVMYFNGNDRILAGSRFDYLPDKIPLDYNIMLDSIVKAIETKIEKEQAGSTLERENFFDKKQRPFSEAMDEARELWNKILDKDDSDLTYNKLDSIIVEIFDQYIALSSVTEKQQDLLELAINEMKHLYEEM